jgi:hypothetical protein
MSKEQIIRDLRALLHNPALSQDEYTTICCAIRELGGKP